MRGGYPLFVDGKIAGGIGVGGGTEEQDCAIAEYVVSVFEELQDTCHFCAKAPAVYFCTEFF